MSRLTNLKQEIPNWNLDSDRQLVKGLSGSTEQVYTGINEVITSLRELEQSTEDCYIRLKHAVNWVTSLSYVKFIENNIQPSSSDGVPQSEPAPPPIVSKTPEQVMAKYRKAIEIALNDLNLKDLKPDEGMTQVEGETAENQTMAAGGNYVTPQLRRKLPFLIGSKEFYSSPYLGIDVGVNVGLTEERLEKLKDEERVKAASPSNKDREGVNQSASVVVSSGIEEAKDAMGRQTVSPKKFDASSYLDSYTSGSANRPFDLDEVDKDEVLPQFNKGEPERVPEPPQIDVPVPDIDVPQPPSIDVPLPPSTDVPEPPSDDVPQPPPITGAKSGLFVDEEVGDVFATIRGSQAAAEVAKPDYKKKMSKLFGDGDDAEDTSLKPSKKPEDLISLYANKAPSNALFGEAEDENPQPKVSKEKKEEISKRLSMFLADEEDEGYPKSGAKKLVGKKNLFGDDDD